MKTITAEELNKLEVGEHEFCHVGERRKITRMKQAIYDFNRRANGKFVTYKHWGGGIALVRAI